MLFIKHSNMFSTTLIPTLGVILASTLFGMVPFFAKSLIQEGMPAAAIVFYRYILTAVVLLPTLIINKDQRAPIFWGIFAGIAMGIGWIGYVAALKSAPVSTVGVLYMTFPMFTLITTWLWFRDRPSHRAVLGAVLIFIAAIIALSPSVSQRLQMLALLLSLSAPVGFGISISTLTNKLSDISPLSRAGCLSCGCVIGLLPLVLSNNTGRIIPESAASWWLIVGIAVITCLLPLSLYALNAPRIGAAKAAIAGGFELPTMFFVGWLAFNEAISSVELIAGAIVIFAIIITPPVAIGGGRKRYD